MSFPKSSINEVRAYTRRNFLRENVDDLAEDEDGPADVGAPADELPEEGWQETRIEYETEDEAKAREAEDEDDDDEFD